VSDDRFPLRDRNGDPLGVDSFVRVSRVNPLAPSTLFEYRGQVRRIEQDAKGPILVIDEWSQGEGKFYTGDRLARPEHVETTRWPSALREALTSRADREVRS
jgi:hypothetical protein